MSLLYQPRLLSATKKSQSGRMFLGRVRTCEWTLLPLLPAHTPTSYTEVIIICLSGSRGLPARIKPPSEGGKPGSPARRKAPGLDGPGKAADRTTCWLACYVLQPPSQDSRKGLRRTASLWYAVLPIKVGRLGLASRRPSPNSPPRCDFASVEANKEGSRRFGFRISRLALLSLGLGG